MKTIFNRNIPTYLNYSNGDTMASPEKNNSDTKKIDVEEGLFEAFDEYETSWLIGALSNDGIVRSNNEDAVFTFFSKLSDTESTPSFGIFIVADGAGGHLNGEKASSLTLRTIASRLMRDVYMPMLSNKDTNRVDHPTTNETIIKAIQEANRLVLEQVEDGGCTCTVAVITGNIVNIGHVGDSRMYLINKAEIDPLTRDHSIVGRLIEIGQLTKEEAKTHPQRSVLYRGIGMDGLSDGEDIEVDIHRKRLKGGDSILLCSDGLWDMVDDDVIHTTVLDAKTPQEACRNLVRKANLNGGHDNISVVIVSSPID